VFADPNVGEIASLAQVDDVLARGTEEPSDVSGAQQRWLTHGFMVQP
jgi:hypothetical protein